MNENELEDLRALIQNIREREIALTNDIGYVLTRIDKKIEATRDQTSASIYSKK